AAADEQSRSCHSPKRFGTRVGLLCRVAGEIDILLRVVQPDLLDQRVCEESSKVGEAAAIADPPSHLETVTSLAFRGNWITGQELERTRRKRQPDERGVVPELCEDRSGICEMLSRLLEPSVEHEKRTDHANGPSLELAAVGGVFQDLVADANAVFDRSAAEHRRGQHEGHR